MLGQLNATREFNKTLWRTDKEETAKYRPPCEACENPSTGVPGLDNYENTYMQIK